MSDATTAILAASGPHQLFGPLDGDDADARVRELKRSYNAMAKSVHPDVCDDERAEEAFKRLTKLFNVARKAVRAGTYGTVAAPAVDDVRVQTRNGVYVVDGGLVAGATCDLYRVHSDEEWPGVMKVVRNPRDGDLVANEARSLKAIREATPEYLRNYVPEYVDSFGWREPGKQPRQAVVLGELGGFYTLAQVRERYPEGIDPKDAAWMLRRVFMALGVAHAAGRVHGAVLPEHVMIHPTMHGVVPVDWKHSVEIGDPLVAVPPGSRGRYTADALERRPAVPGLDLAMAAQCVADLLDWDATPRPMRAFLNGCRMDTMRRAPQDAFALVDEYTDVIERMWGPRKYRPFSMA